MEALPNLTVKIAHKHQLTDLQPIANMSFNYVATGLQNEEPIILKLGANNKALAKEATCLQAFAQHGAAEVIASKPGMIFIQRANPGTTLKEYFPSKDKQATSILCERIQQLHTAEIPKQHNFLNLKDLLTTLDNDLAIPLDILSTQILLRRLQ